jgi:AraC family transcriptional regulator, activator of mtrCDE
MGAIEAPEGAVRRSPVEVALETALSSYQLRIEVITRARYSGDWVAREPETSRGQFHLIEQGECTIIGPSIDSPITLRGGDFIVFPKGTAHMLSACPQAESAASAVGSTTILCGVMELVTGTRNPVLSALPSHFVVRNCAANNAFQQMAQTLIDVSSSDVVGHYVVRNKLADGLFTMAVLDYVRGAHELKGIFAALTDRRIASVLAAIQARPGADWTVHSMAAVAGMSRTSFTLRFAELMGLAPIQYLTQWRVSEAHRMLRDQGISVATVAELLGYSTEASFRRTFKRLTGLGPGQVRSANRVALY